MMYDGKFGSLSCKKIHYRKGLGAREKLRVIGTGEGNQSIKRDFSNDQMQCKIFFWGGVVNILHPSPFDKVTMTGNVGYYPKEEWTFPKVHLCRMVLNRKVCLKGICWLVHTFLTGNWRCRNRIGKFIVHFPVKTVKFSFLIKMWTTFTQKLIQLYINFETSRNN